MSSPIYPKQVKSFVQDTLGCTCPEAVFKNQEFDSGITINNIKHCKKLCVGERLLIYLIDIESITDLPSSISSLVNEGRRERDSRGLNRFRLVLGANDIDAVRKEARTAFESIDDLDDKLHLHVISKHALEQLQ
jgi:hypothetical protein